MTATKSGRAVHFVRVIVVDVNVRMVDLNGLALVRAITTASTGHREDSLRCACYIKKARYWSLVGCSIKHGTNEHWLVILLDVNKT